jgi:hypothetical protein
MWAMGYVVPVTVPRIRDPWSRKKLIPSMGVMLERAILAATVQSRLLAVGVTYHSSK